MNHHVTGALPPWVLNLIARALCIGVLVVPLTLNLPRVIDAAHAAPLEDCDADGFDDSTGVAVPWAGFDETRGDTPAGPGTADWWIQQNATGTGTSGGSGTSTDGGTSSGGSSAGGTAADSSGAGTSAQSSPGSTSGSGGVSKSSSVPAQAPSTPAATAVGAATTNGPTVSTPASVTSGASQASSTTAESSQTAASVSASGGGGPTATGGSLWEALTVGFTGKNTELFAGLGLLGALALAGALALGLGALRDVSARARTHKTDVQHAEETAVSTA